MKRYMLDTNTVSHLLKGHPTVAQRIISFPVASLYVSAITEGELFFGLAKRPDARRLHAIVGEFLKRVEVLPWDSTVTRQYGIVRADMERNGRALAPPDLLIAAHALAVGAILVSSDKAFGLVPNLSFEDWSF